MITATKIATALSCPHRYYRTYILGEKDIPNSSAMWGSVVHDVGEQIITDPTIPAREVYDTTFRRAVEALPVPYLSYTPLSDLYRAGLRVLPLFYPYAGTQQALERSLSAEIDGVLLNGRIDLITTDGRIVDFKTSKYPPKHLDRDPQTVMYQYLYYRTYGEAPRGMVFHYLRTNTVYTAPIHPIHVLEDTYLRPWMFYLTSIQSLPPACSTCPPFCARQQEYLRYDKDY